LICLRVRTSLARPISLNDRRRHERGVGTYASRTGRASRGLGTGAVRRRAVHDFDHRGGDRVRGRTAARRCSQGVASGDGGSGVLGLRYARAGVRCRGGGPCMATSSLPANAAEPRLTASMRRSRRSAAAMPRFWRPGTSRISRRPGSTSSTPGTRVVRGGRSSQAPPHLTSNPPGTHDEHHRRGRLVVRAGRPGAAQRRLPRRAVRCALRRARRSPRGRSRG
jgi:hypothetical protein